MTRAGGVREAVEGFWFGSIPAEPYAVLRMLFGLLGLLNLLGTTPVEVHWSLDGLAPLPGTGVGLRSFLASSSVSGAAGWGAFLALLLCFSAMTIGAATSWAVPFAYLGTLAQTYWNPLPLFGAHKVLIAMLFCLLWVDSGRVLSVDAWLRRRREAGRGQQAPATNELPRWPIRLLQVQIAVVYLNSGLWKFFGAAWRDGSALQLATSVNLYRRFPETLPPELDWVAAALTYFTLLWEVSFPLMVALPATRLATLASGVAIHLGIMAVMEVGTFSLVMMAAYVAFLEPRTVAAVARSLSTFIRRLRGTSGKQEGQGNGRAREGPP